MHFALLALLVLFRALSYVSVLSLGDIHFFLHLFEVVRDRFCLPRFATLLRPSPYRAFRFLDLRIRDSFSISLFLCSSSIFSLALVLCRLPVVFKDDNRHHGQPCLRGETALVAPRYTSARCTLFFTPFVDPDDIEKTKAPLVSCHRKGLGNCLSFPFWHFSRPVALWHPFFLFLLLALAISFDTDFSFLLLPSPAPPSTRLPLYDRPHHRESMLMQNRLHSTAL